jgi:hypothetical protein
MVAYLLCIKFEIDSTRAMTAITRAKILIAKVIVAWYDEREPGDFSPAPELVTCGRLSGSFSLAFWRRLPDLSLR